MSCHLVDDNKRLAIKNNITSNRKRVKTQSSGTRIQYSRRKQLDRNGDREREQRRWKWKWKRKSKGKRKSWGSKIAPLWVVPLWQDNFGKLLASGSLFKIGWARTQNSIEFGFVFGEKIIISLYETRAEERSLESFLNSHFVLWAFECWKISNHANLLSSQCESFLIARLSAVDRPCDSRIYANLGHT